LTAGISLSPVPTCGGVELDLKLVCPAGGRCQQNENPTFNLLLALQFFEAVESLDGIQAISSKKKWARIADILKIPKSAQNRESRLQALYYKYLLSFSMLSCVQTFLCFCFDGRSVCPDRKNTKHWWPKQKQQAQRPTQSPPAANLRRPRFFLLVFCCCCCC
jgi:hypothetical protein